MKLVLSEQQLPEGYLVTIDSTLAIDSRGRFFRATAKEIIDWNIKEDQKRIAKLEQLPKGKTMYLQVQPLGAAMSVRMPGGTVLTNNAGIRARDKAILFSWKQRAFIGKKNRHGAAIFQRIS